MVPLFASLQVERGVFYQNKGTYVLIPLIEGVFPHFNVPYVRISQLLEIVQDSQYD